jgi:hypothetical protein
MRIIARGVLEVVARPRRRCGGRGCEQAHDGQSYDEAAQIKRAPGGMLPHNKRQA